MPLFRLDALPLGPDVFDRLETFLLLALSSVIRGRLVMDAILDRHCVALQSRRTIDILLAEVSSGYQSIAIALGRRTVMEAPYLDV